MITGLELLMAAACVEPLLADVAAKVEDDIDDCSEDNDNGSRLDNADADSLNDWLASSLTAELDISGVASLSSSLDI